jgi:hypothetical protein
METMSFKAINTSKFFDVDKLPKVNDSIECINLHTTIVGEITEQHYEKFLKACLSVIESEAFAALLSIYEMSLSYYDIKLNVCVNRDGSRLVISPDDYIANDSTISKQEDIVCRNMLVFVFKTNWNKDRVEKEFGNLFNN